jgi:hypothetical protein
MARLAIEKSAWVAGVLRILPGMVDTNHITVCGWSVVPAAAQSMARMAG